METETLNKLDDLFTLNDVNAADAASKEQSRESGISSKEYREWFDSHKSHYNLMIQMDISCTIEMCNEIPEYIYEISERIHYAISSKHSLSVSDVHISSDKRGGHIKVRFWVSYNENVTAFLNLYCMLHNFHTAFCQSTKNDVYRRAVYGVRVCVFRADGYERSLQNLSDGYSVLSGSPMSSAWNLRYNSYFNVGTEKISIEEICNELVAKYIFKVRGQWTLTWQTIRYFWLKMRRQPNRNLPDDWYEKTRDEFWMKGTNV